MNRYLVIMEARRPVLLYGSEADLLAFQKVRADDIGKMRGKAHEEDKLMRVELVDGPLPDHMVDFPRYYLNTPHGFQAARLAGTLELAGLLFKALQSSNELLINKKF